MNCGLHPLNDSIEGSEAARTFRKSAKTLLWKISALPGAIREKCLDGEKRTNAAGESSAPWLCF